jgi:hypothetical protein
VEWLLVGPLKKALEYIVEIASRRSKLNLNNFIIDKVLGVVGSSKRRILLLWRRSAFGGR